VLNLTKPATWIQLTLVLLVIGFVLHQAGHRIGAVGTVTRAAFGA
jgi:hypothetical protein